MKKPEQPSEILLVRHGLAVDVGENGVRSDGARMLSAEGRARTAEVARGLKALECIPGIILSSPLRRAQETAQILGATLDRNVEIRESEALLPGAEPADALREIAAAGCETVLVVGHMPNLSCLASLLLAGNENVAISFRKAGVCALQCEGKVVPGAASLQWLLPPTVLRVIGSGQA